MCIRDRLANARAESGLGAFPKCPIGAGVVGRSEGSAGRQLGQIEYGSPCGSSYAGRCQPAAGLSAQWLRPGRLAPLRRLRVIWQA
eukprot:2035290-Alexandrium_andersonii.AAC.1